MATILDELQALLQLEQANGEAPLSYAKRMAVKANNLKDDEWQGLSEPAQKWVNDALEAVENKTEVPLPEGLEAAAEPEAEEAVAEETEVDPPAGGKKPAKKKAVPKKVTVKKAAKPKASANGAKRGPKGGFAGTDKIKILTKENPFRAGTKSAAWWAKYENGMTVEAAIAAGVPRHHIRWDSILENIKIG